MDQPIKIVVVEDDLLIAEGIYRSLKSLGYNVLKPVENYTSALEIINLEKPGLIFLDIRLSGSKDGIDLANEINALYDIPFIFLTSNSDPLTIERAKKTNPAGYLLKPFTKDDLYSTIEIGLQNYKKMKELKALKPVPVDDFIMVKHNKAFVKLNFNEILYINSQHIYIEIVTISGKRHLVRTSLNEYLKLLPAFFLRIHRSYVINVHYIEEIIEQSVVLKGKTIPVSKVYRKSLNEFLNKA
jgi:two-component system, LytTR family, response regulator LytT